MKYLLYLSLIIFVSCKSTETSTSSTASTEKGLPEVEKFVSEMDKYSGFFNFYWDAKKDKIYLEVDKPNTEILYINSLAAGVGSNDIGLDRGQLGDERIVKFERHGTKMLMVQPNYGYRAISDNEEEVKSVREAFAQSVLWGFDIKAQSDWSVIVDISDFLLRDSHGVAQRLSRMQQGTYKLDKSRSTFYRDNTMNFPQNSEFESIITFTGQPKGGYIRSVTPSADAVTVRMHHSFVQLPDGNYEPREYDPRSSFNNISFQDYATPIEESLVKRYIARHRLVKKDPGAAVSEPVEPIIYYLDRGAPEPVRSALLDGARWWNEAFEAAGFSNAFSVEMLPEGAHPLDVRYNVIQWVHRSTRGWSYGASVVDPRTGEIIKGHVSLGSLRVRQDFLIAQGLLNQYDEGTEEMKEMALARIRQLSAHEVGHTIGLRHNYASSINNRASVMDYPHPLVELDENGNISLDNVYDTGIGEWDKVAIRFGYSQVNDKSELDKILEDAFEDGLFFITDRDARAQNGAHPTAHLWDNGENAATELTRMLEIRRKALDQLSEKSLPTGEAYSSLEEILVPIYLFHRYQVEAAVKAVGGLKYNYAIKGGNQEITGFISSKEQMDALDALLSCVDPATLKLNEELLSMIPPKAAGFSRNRETFESKVGPVWDYYAAVENAVAVVIDFILMPERANRLELLKNRNSDQPGLEAVLSKMTKSIIEYKSNNSSDQALNRLAQWKYINSLMMLANNNESRSDVMAISRQELKDIQQYASRNANQNTLNGKHFNLISESIDMWLDDPEEYQEMKDLKVPDGSPIGSFELEYCSSN